MTRRKSRVISEFMNFLAGKSGGTDSRLPSLPEISKQMGVSVPTVREQMEVARALGFIEAKPKMGIRRLPYRFKPAVMQSLVFAITTEPELFDDFSSLRNHIESAYFIEAAQLLHPGDIHRLETLIKTAREKLSEDPIIIPHAEHRSLHLTIFHRLNNEFVTGLLEAYWDAYEMIGLDVYTNIEYLGLVWSYHEKIVNALADNEIKQAHQVLIEHMGMLSTRQRSIPQQHFE